MRVVPSITNLNEADIWKNTLNISKCLHSNEGDHKLHLRNKKNELAEMKRSRIK